MKFHKQNDITYTMQLKANYPYKIQYSKYNKEFEGNIFLCKNAAEFLPQLMNDSDGGMR